MKVFIQCIDSNGNKGTFVKDLKSNKQLTKTFNNAFDLFNSKEYKDLKLNNSAL
jgi:hypothetical protein